MALVQLLRDADRIPGLHRSRRLDGQRYPGLPRPEGCLAGTAARLLPGLHELGGRAHRVLGPEVPGLALVPGCGAERRAHLDRGSGEGRQARNGHHAEHRWAAQPGRNLRRAARRAPRHEHGHRMHELPCAQRTRCSHEELFRNAEAAAVRMRRIPEARDDQLWPEPRPGRPEAGRGHRPGDRPRGGAGLDAVGLPGGRFSAGGCGSGAYPMSWSTAARRTTMVTLP